MEEEKNRERKERIDTIFMYESRIKGRVIFRSGYHGWPRLRPFNGTPSIFSGLWLLPEVYKVFSTKDRLLGTSYWLFEWHIKNKLFIFNNILDRTAEAVHNGKQTYPLNITTNSTTVITHFNNYYWNLFGAPADLHRPNFGLQSADRPNFFKYSLNCI